MTEAEAQAWLVDSLGVSRETLARLDLFRQMVIAENDRQNLVSAGSIPYFWARHIVDSAQLLSLNQRPDATWLDLGTGAGFPGMVIAMLHSAPITFVESRRRRVEFLRYAVESLGLEHVTVELCQLESYRTRGFDVISARAFAPLGRLLPLAHRFSTTNTVWLLPKGRSAHAEVESVRESWQGMFHVKHSVSDPGAAIIVASGIAPRAR